MRGGAGGLPATAQAGADELVDHPHHHGESRRAGRTAADRADRAVAGPAGDQVEPTTPAVKCPAIDPTVPVPPTDGLTTCDIARATVYTLGPEAMQLGLINVDPPKSLTADYYEVTLVLDPASASAWAAFTGEHPKDHIAFIRDNLVVEAPIIEEQVTSGRIALTTQTAQGAAQLAQLVGRPG